MKLMDNRSIDIIIPTFRLNEELLSGIIHLPKPAGFKISYYIISDNPVVNVPEAIKRLDEQGLIKLLINQKNIGAPGTRNVGINAGKNKWILFLDDDIKPQEDLLLVYSTAIEKHPDAIGFAGVTIFPEPFNAVTKAVQINGTISSFTDAQHKASLTWSPTANVMLNRHKIDKNLFDANLVNAEDIDFLTRNSLLFKEKYISLPEAVVFHPWWNNGKPQTARMLSYGKGASQIARKNPVKQYTFRDFTNTLETILLLLILSPLFYFTGYGKIAFILLGVLLLSEFLTNWIKAILTGKTWSLPVAFNMLWAKNCYEFGYLYSSLKDGYINGFAQRIDMGFNKPHPSPFRTNRWKIIKMILLVVLVLIAVVISF